MEENNNEKKEVVTVNTTEKKVITTGNNPEEKKTDTTDTNLDEKTIEEHMEENVKNTKVVIDWKTLFTYVLLLAIVVVGVIVIFHLYDKYHNGEIIPTTVPTTTKGLYTTTTSTSKVEFKAPSTTTTQEIRTVFDKNKTRRP